MSQSFIKDVSSIGLSKIIVVAAGLITTILIAREIGPDGNGAIATLLVYPSLFVNFGALGIRQSTTFLIGKQLYNEEDIKSSILQIWIISTIISIIISALLLYNLTTVGQDKLLLILAIAPIPFSLFNSYVSGIFLGKNEIREFNRINWIPSVLVLALSILLVFGLDLGIEGYLLALLGGPLYVAYFFGIRNNFFKQFTLKIKWNIIKSLLSLGIVYALALLTMNLNYKIDIILLERMSSLYEIGIYSKGSAITQYLWQIPMFLSTIVFARGANAKNSMAFSVKVVQLIRVSFVIIGIASIGLYFVSDYLVILMFGQDFSESSSPLKILLPGVLLLTFYKVANMDLAGRGKPWISIYAMLPALVINVLLNIQLIPNYGANGAALASTISYSFAALLFMYFYTKEVKITLKEMLLFKKTDFDPIFKLTNRIK